jgi:hypothetical protein
MNTPLRLLFVCEHSGACASFQGCLEREGCHLLVASNTQRAVKVMLSARPVDAILIHHQDIGQGSMIGSSFKLIRPELPVLLVTPTWPSNGALPPAVDALCYATMLSRRAAHDIAGFVRYLLFEDKLGLKNQPKLGEQGFTPQKPTYLN